MAVRSIRACLFTLAAVLVPRVVTADSTMIAVGGAESTDGPAFAGELELRLGRVTATARIDHGETVLAGFDFAVTRHHLEARWDDACLAQLRTESSTARCWIKAARRESATTIERALGASAGVRRDGDRYDLVGALRIHPTTDSLRTVIELAVTGPIAGRDTMYVNHARFSPGWFVRVQWGISAVRIGGEVGMTGLASRTEAGTPRAETYALATLAMAVKL